MSGTDGDEEFARLVAEEDLILSATELVVAAMEKRGVNRSELAAMLGVSKGEVTQRLSGTRNLTLRSLATMLHVLGEHAEVSVRSGSSHAKSSIASGGHVLQLVRPLTQTPVEKIPLGSAWHSLESGYGDAIAR